MSVLDDLLPQTSVTKTTQLTTDGVTDLVRIKFTYFDGHIGRVHLTAEQAKRFAADLMVVAYNIELDE